MRVLYAREGVEPGKGSAVKRTDYVDVCEYPSEDKREVFTYMQGDFMTRERLRRVEGLVDRGEIDHTSMSVGDLAIDRKGRVWRCEASGWREVTFS